MIKSRYLQTLCALVTLAACRDDGASSGGSSAAASAAGGFDSGGLDSGDASKGDSAPDLAFSVVDGDAGSAQDGSGSGADLSGDGSLTGGDDSLTRSDGSLTGSDGSLTGSDGSLTGSDGSLTGSDGSATGSDGSSTGADGGSGSDASGADATGTDGSGTDGSGADGNGASVGSPPPSVWIRRQGGAGTDEAKAVTVDGAGNVYATGAFTGNVNFGGESNLVSAGQEDIFVVKYAADGKHLWSLAFGTTGTDIGLAIAVDAAGDIVFGGQHAGNLNLGAGSVCKNTSCSLVSGFIGKLSGATAKLLWSTPFGVYKDSRVRGLAVDGAGNVLACGHIDSKDPYVDGQHQVQSPGNGHEAVVVRYTGGGGHVWGAAFGGAGEDGCSAVQAFGNKTILAGWFSGSANLGGGAQTGGGGTDAFVIKLDEQGKYMWSGIAGGNGKDEPYALVVDTNGEPVVAGRFDGKTAFPGGTLSSKGGEDAFVTRFSDVGIHKWMVGFGGTADDAVYSLVRFANGDLGIAGMLQNTADGFAPAPLTSAGLADIVLARLDPKGKSLWGKRFGGAAWDVGNGLAVTPTGGLVLVGSFQGNVDLGDGGAPGLGGSDTFFVQFKP